MKILLNDSGDNTLGSTRVHHSFLAKYLEKVGCTVHLNDWENYGKYDICIFGKSTPYEQLVNAKRTAPNLLVGNTNPSSGTKEKIKKVKFSDFSIAGSLEERDANLNLSQNIFLFPVYLNRLILMVWFQSLHISDISSGLQDTIYFF